MEKLPSQQRDSDSSSLLTRNPKTVTTEEFPSILLESTTFPTDEADVVKGEPNPHTHSRDWFRCVAESRMERI